MRHRPQCALIRWGQRDGVAERLIEGAAEALRAGIAGNVETLADTLTPLVKRNAGWQGIFVGRGTVERLLRGAQEELERMKAHPAHDLRVLLARRLEGPCRPGFRGRRRIPTLSANASVRRSERSSKTPRLPCGPPRLLAAALDRLRAAVQAESSGFVQGVERVEEVFISQLRANEEFRGSFNRGVPASFRASSPRSGLIEGVTGYLAGLLKNTDEREFVGRIEDAVWNDLQYIRVNGAVVGGIVGILLAVFSSLVHP